MAVIGTAGGVGQCSLSRAGLPFQGIRDPSRHGPTQSFFKLHLQPPLFSSMLFSQTVFCPQTSRVSQTPWVSSHILVCSCCICCLPSSLNSFAGEIHLSRSNLKICDAHCLLAPLCFHIAQNWDSFHPLDMSSLTEMATALG